MRGMQWLLGARRDNTESISGLYKSITLDRMNDPGRLWIAIRLMSMHGK